MGLAWHMAKRLYSHSGDVKRVSRPAIRIATLGVMLGVAVMIIAVCVVLGFKSEVQHKVMGMGSHVQVFNQFNKDNIEQLPIVLDDNVMKQLQSVEGVKHVQRFCNQAGMLKTDETFQGVIIKGVGSEYDLTFLKEHLVDGEVDAFSDTASTKRILISNEIAKQLKYKVGDKVIAYFIDGKLRAADFIVSGIYSTNISEFDKTIVFTDIYKTRRMTGFTDNQYSGAELLVSDLERLDETSDNVAKKVRELAVDDDSGSCYVSAPITKLYPGIFSWLSLLDTNIWVILGLMISVAAFTMISGLLIIILERTQFIGTMKAMGATNSSLRHLFLYFSSFIIFKGILWGNIVGLLLVFAQSFFGIISLDGSTYYVDVLPIEINWLFIILINVGTMLVSFLVLILPSYLVSRIHPARSIRFE